MNDEQLAERLKASLPNVKGAKLERFTRQLRFLEGKADRLSGAGCLSANGAYLDGFYYDQREEDLPYLTQDEVSELKGDG